MAFKGLGPSILKVVNVSKKKKIHKSAVLCSTLAVETPDHRIQTRLRLLPGGLFPLSTSHYRAGAPWVTVALFSLSALCVRGALYLATKACRRLPTAKVPSPPRFLKQPRDLSANPCHAGFGSSGEERNQS